MKLKINLLIPVLENNIINQKYSKSYLNIKYVFELEKEEKTKFPKYLINKFDELTKTYNNFLNEIPLNVVEKYYYNNKEDVNKFVMLMYKENEITDMRIMELYETLETFYEDCFSIAVFIANKYSLEIKLNEDKNSTQDYF